MSCTETPWIKTQVVPPFLDIRNVRCGEFGKAAAIHFKCFLALESVRSVKIEAYISETEVYLPGLESRVA